MRARKAMTAVAWTAGVLVSLLFVGWLGFRIEPPPFPSYPEARPAPIEMTGLPAGLPAPVERFYRTVYGDRVPVVTSAVLTGRARVSPGWADVPAGPVPASRTRRDGVTATTSRCVGSAFPSCASTSTTLTGRA